jgi:hypothetical protein
MYTIRSIEAIFTKTVAEMVTVYFEVSANLLHLKSFKIMSGCVQRTVTKYDYTSIMGTLSKGVNRPGSKTDYSPPSSAEIHNGGAITPLHHTSSWRGAELIKHRDNFTLPYSEC